MWQEAYRIFEIDKKNPYPKTLYHPYKGSKFLPLDKPLIAYQGIVFNPGKKLNPYRAGWHVALNKKIIDKYLNHFTADRTLCICRVLVKETRPKPRSKSSILLAKEMMVLSKDWMKAIFSVIKKGEVNA